MRDILKLKPIYDARDFLVSKMKTLNVGADVIGRIKMTPGELYVNTKFTLGGIVDLLRPSVNATKEVGVCNFDGNKLDQGRFFTFGDITVQYAKEDSEKKTYEVDYKDELPPVLLASDLILKQGDTVLFSLPISAIQRAKKSDEFYKDLGTLFVLEPARVTQIQIQSPDGASLESGKYHYIKVAFKGFETLFKQ